MKLLVHSCDSRKWLWEHWEKCFKRSGWDIDYEFIDGEEAFTDQMKKALERETDEYIFYTLDDYFIREPIDFNKYWDMAHDLKVDALRLQPGVQFNSLPYRFDPGYNVTEFYRFEENEGLLKQTRESAYHISMQTSIWRRDYLLKCIIPGLNPWEFEGVNMGERLGDVYWVPSLPRWYIDGVRKGILLDAAKPIIYD